MPVSYTHLDVYKRQYYHRVGVGLCEYDKATGTETVKVPRCV